MRDYTDEDLGEGRVLRTFNNGTKIWYKDGEFHREDGPAVDCADGHKFWYKNAKRHREDGPAIEYADGTKCWYKNGKCHREDGPAIEYPNGYKEYWLFNKRYDSLPSPEEIKIIRREMTVEVILS